MTLESTKRPKWSQKRIKSDFDVFKNLLFFQKGDVSLNPLFRSVEICYSLAGI